jgi:hypothetical protein
MNSDHQSQKGWKKQTHRIKEQREIAMKIVCLSSINMPRSGLWNVPWMATIMRERAEAFGGNFNVTSVHGQATKIEVRVPVDGNHP